MKYEKGLPQFHKGEPWFLVRAQDKLSPLAIVAYGLALEAEASHYKGTTKRRLKKQAEQIREIHKAFREWQQKNPELVKLPD